MNTLKKNFSAFVLLCLMAISAQAAVQDSVGIYENLDGYIPDNIVLFDRDSNQVNLKELIDKPTVVSFVYFTCPGICSPLLDGVARVIDQSDLVLGRDYQSITISFDTTDKPSLARSKKKNYLTQIKKKVDPEAWIWLTGDSLNVARATRALGFYYKKEGKDFVHAGAIMAVSPQAKITRYLYGIQYLPFDFKMAMIEAAEGRSGPTINKVLSYCFSYDPQGKKYVFNITKITGIIVLLFALTLFLVLALKKKPKTVGND